MKTGAVRAAPVVVPCGDWRARLSRVAVHRAERTIRSAVFDAPIRRDSAPRVAAERVFAPRKQEPSQ